jgi:hypothetical protein
LKLRNLEEKRAAFQQASASNRGDLVRTQVERWRDANRARLSQKQIDYLGELITSITADSYADGPKGEEARRKSRALIDANSGLFSQDEILEMQPHAPCIAKPR